MKKTILLMVMPFIFGCSGSNSFDNPGNGLFSINNIKSNLQFLASDELEGRETATRGEKVASEFIAMELQKYGVKPFGDNGTYFQNFDGTLVGIDSNSTITFNNENGGYDFKIGKDFNKAYYKIPSKIAETKDKEIVFAGFGISADEFNYDDYKGLDVKGKIVLAFFGEPYSTDSAYFKGEKRTSYSRATYKLETAKSHGAAGILLLPDDYILNNLSRFGLTAKSKSFRYYPKDTEVKIEENSPSFILSEEASIIVLKGQKYSYAQLKEMFEKHEAFPSFTLKGKVSFNVDITTETAPVRNVVGIIEGTDPALKNQYVTIGAHYDHLGIEDGVVYNGANDNGSGTVGLLEVAKAAATIKENKRPVVVIFYTAEEKGLIGSNYFASNSNIIKDVVVNINIDMIGSQSTDSVYSVGSAMLSRELYDLENEVNSNTTKFVLDYKYDDPNDPEKIYYRSDHYNFAKKGIPSVFFTSDDTINYHMPTDDIEFINFEKLLKVSKLVYNLGVRIANLDHKLKVDAKEVINN